ncbi:hypothetical protein AWP65_06860 [Escherichia coli]|nr:hypothetical protein AWP52_25275 [Escherichia coli]OKW06585.1 hypothetical protein AWP65_06860 [Escherichia coli]
MMSLWDALRMNMMISYQELVRTFLRNVRTPFRLTILTQRQEHRSPLDTIPQSDLLIGHLTFFELFKG